MSAVSPGADPGTRVTVTFVVPVGHRLGGAEKMLATFLENVDRGRVRPNVVFLEDGPFVAACAALGITTRLVPTGRLRNVSRGLRTIGRLRQVFAADHPDLIVSWFGKSHPWVWPAAASAGAGSRVIWWQHSVVDPSDRFGQMVTAIPARAVGTSSAAAADAQERFWPRRRTFVVHPGITEHDGGELRTSARRELGVDERDVLIGMIARMQRWKGQHHLLRAIADLRSRGIGCVGLLVGGDAYGMDPGYVDEVRRLRIDLGLTDVVRWIDHVPNPQRYLSALDIFVNASKYEGGVSLALIEAMAASRCIVAVRNGGSPEAIVHGENGLLIDASDGGLLAAALGPLVGDRQRRLALASAARATYESAFTADAFTRALEHRLVMLCQADFADELAKVARRPR